MNLNIVRFDDGDIYVSLAPEEFDRHMAKLLPEREVKEIGPLCDRIVYWRGDIPKPEKLGITTIWWALGFLVFPVFLYGAYCLLRLIIG